MLAMPWEAMPWDAGLAILGVYSILRARKGRRLGGIRGTGTPVNHPSTIRRSPAEATSRPGILKKSIPKSWSKLDRLLNSKVLPKAFKNDSQNLQKIIGISMQVSIELLIRFCIDFWSLLQPAEPRFNFYLQHFCGVQYFPRSWGSTKK